MQGYKYLWLVALLIQYLYFSNVAFNGKLKTDPSPLLSARIALQRPSFEILVLAFLGFQVAHGFWGLGFEGDLLLSGLLATIFVGRTITWLWPLARVRKFGYLLSLIPLWALAALGAYAAWTMSPLSN